MGSTEFSARNTITIQNPNLLMVVCTFTDNTSKARETGSSEYHFDERLLFASNYSPDNPYANITCIHTGIGHFALATSTVHPRKPHTSFEKLNNAKISFKTVALVSSVFSVDASDAWPLAGSVRTVAIDMTNDFEFSSSRLNQDRQDDGISSHLMTFTRFTNRSETPVL